jgi:hypothetical protein
VFAELIGVGVGLGGLNKAGNLFNQSLSCGVVKATGQSS